MTPAEFESAVRVTAHDPLSRTTAAARLVLVDGWSVNGAATHVGVRNAPVFRAVKRLRSVGGKCPTCGGSLA